MPPGQESGQGFDWRQFVDHLVAERGSLAAAAEVLAERRQFAEDVDSVERGLRRLRSKGTGSGGVWGQRALACFGLPAEVTDRVRWMGQYHTRFSDIPVSLCAELLAPWDRPPIQDSPARIWLMLARIGLALRRREDVAPQIDQALRFTARAPAAAVAELALVEAFVHSRQDRARVAPALARAEAAMAEVERQDRACLFARWIDQRAYPLNKPRSGRPDHGAAEALYRQIPSGGPLFAECRRENGLGWSLLRMGRQAEALEHARAGVEAAGDAGSVRMRAMALNLLAAVTGEARPRARAAAIAQRLEDEALALRFQPKG